MAYEGSCHCGTVRFTVQADVPTEAMSCNCSHCRRKGFLLTFVPADQFRIDAGEDALETYEFYKHKIHHKFCTTCGTQAFAAGEGPGGAKMAAINLRCVPSIDLDALKVNKVNGASF